MRSALQIRGRQALLAAKLVDFCVVRLSLVDSFLGNMLRVGIHHGEDRRNVLACGKADGRRRLRSGYPQAGIGAPPPRQHIARSACWPRRFVVRQGAACAEDRWLLDSGSVTLW